MRLLERITILLFLAVLLVFAGVTGYDKLTSDRTPPRISCDSDELEISVSDPEEVLLQGVTASDSRDGDLTDQIMISNVSQLITDNTAKVTYMVFDASNNMASWSRTVRYTDYEKPRFHLSLALEYTVGETVTLLDRLTASDVIDGDISDHIRITAQDLDTIPGIYNITAQVSNSLGDTASLPLRVVIREQGQVRMVHLTEQLIYLNVGDPFEAEDYIKSVRNRSNQTVDKSHVNIEDAVDTETPGHYFVTYTYTDGGVVDTVYLSVVVN